MGYVHFCIGRNGLTCAYAHWMQSIVGIMVSRITKCSCWPPRILCQEKLSSVPKFIPMCCTNDTHLALQQTVTIRDQEGDWHSLGTPIFWRRWLGESGIHTWIQNKKLLLFNLTFSCSRVSYPSTTYQAGATTRSVASLLQQSSEGRSDLTSRKLGHNRSNCNNL